MRRIAAVVMLAAGLSTLGASGTAAQDFDVDLALVLAVDVSRSMDLDEQRVQRDGYAAAFRHPEVIAAIASGLVGRIAVTYMEWAGATYQSVIVPWRIIAGRQEAEAFAAELAAAPIMRERGTSISGGLLAAARQLAESNVSGFRRVVDISGDGANNIGSPVVPMRDQLVDEGITINGLPIMIRQQEPDNPYGIDHLDIYYEDCVIGGPGAFMITVDDLDRFAVAIRRKLVLEIAGLPPRLMPAASPPRAEPRVDCLIGEKARGRWLDPFIK
ncbi:MAG: DUF1194 domain-containing protein [Bauldia sp.]